MRTPHLAPASVLSLVVCLSAPFAQADTVYRCVDGKGKVTYSDDTCEKQATASKQDKVLTMEHPPATPRPAASSPLGTTTAPGKPASPEVTFRLYYDNKDAPVEYTEAQVEGAIRQAAQAWSSGCKISIRYAGKTEFKGPGSMERVVVRWRPDYFTATHPALEGIHIAGTGSVGSGISLLPRQPDLLHVLTHELGHVIGVGHRHSDKSSVMSYLAGNLTQPSLGDYLACNLVMQKQFGVRFDPPLKASRDPDAGMSDRDALRQKFDPNLPAR